MKKFTLLLFMSMIMCLFIHVNAQTGSIRVVVLGSSTAAGTGPTDINNAWVNRYRQYIKSINPLSEVINLAYGGFTTYKIMPDGFTPPAGRPEVDTYHNITKAISLSPNVIIVNLPSNDVASGFSIEEQIANFDTIINHATSNGIPIYITTTQPRNMETYLMEQQMAMRDSINDKMGDRAIDFWTDIANTNGTIKTIFDSGDGVHLNDTAHLVLTNRVIAKDILIHSMVVNETDTINIDFGSNLSEGNWNNLDNAITCSVSNMVNSQGENTGVSISIDDAFTGINTTGTTTPGNNVDFVSTSTSDSFFGSVGDHSGITEPTGGFTLSGLSYNSLYSFTFFASRTGVSDNREAKYTIHGTTIDSVFLDAANNTDNVAVISNIQPTNDGVITIDVCPGPNNTNSKEYYYIGAIRIVAERQEVVYDIDGTIKIDLGSDANTTVNWNNLTSGSGTQTLSDLINTEGNNTGIALWVHDAFTGINTSGTTTPDAALDFDPNATSDSFFGSEGEHSGVTEPTGGITLSGLDENSVYSFTFFASRDGVTDNRETRYTVKGKTEAIADLNPSNNTSNIASAEYIRPDTSGVITVVASPGPNNNNSVKYYYLGALQIDYKDSIESTVGIYEQPSMSDNLVDRIYPNPCKESVNINYYVPETGKVQITIYNLLGQVEKILVDENQRQGSYRATWSLGSNGSGIYICQIKVTARGNVYQNTQRFISSQ